MPKPIVFKQANGALVVKIAGEDREPSRSEARRLASVILGPTGRIWFEADGHVVIGKDTRPGREVVGEGPTLREAFEAAFLYKASKPRQSKSFAKDGAFPEFAESTQPRTNEKNDIP